MKQNDFPYYLSRFFQSYLPGNRNVSENTIFSYRDTFTKLLSYMKEERGIAPDKVSFSDLQYDTITNFLSYLENDLGCSISTRNQRLAALKSFFRYVEIERPDLLVQCHLILTIKNKKSPKPVIEYLTTEETKLLLEQPDASTRKGLRDLALLALMYDSAARVQEICDLTVKSLRLAAPATVRLYGKGRKTRDVPLDAPCVDILKQYLTAYGLERKELLDTPLFFNSRKDKLSRSGISYILSKYIDKANKNGGNIAASITPHCLRHSKAMHMVEADINLIYIRDLLGHESIETTQVYAKANAEMRRKALRKMEEKSPDPALPDWNENPSIMEFLHGLK